MQLSSVQELKARVLSETRIIRNVAAKSAIRWKVAGLGEVAPALPRPRVAVGFAAGRQPAKRQDFLLAVRAFDQSPATLAIVDRIVEVARGEVDQRYIVMPRARPQVRPAEQKKARPIFPGCSVGHFRVSAGTLGAFVALPDGMLYMLSNNHVLADTNRGARHDPILQPGRVDGGRQADVVASLARAVPLSKSGNLFDAAVAAVHREVDHVELYAGRTLSGAGQAGLGERVWKVGRTTGRTQGVITAFGMDDVVVDYSDEGDGSLPLSFNGQIEIKSERGHFSLGGDSGSLILNRETEAVALLFAGSEASRVTYASPIAPVLEAFGAALV